MPPRLLEAVFEHMEVTLRETSAMLRRMLVLHQSGTDLVVAAFRGGTQRGAQSPLDADGTGCRPHEVRRKALVLLTPREQQVLQLLGLGQSNRQISRCLGLAEKTVKNYLSSLFPKLGVTDRTTAVLVALRQGLISMDPMERGEFPQ